MLGRIIQFAHRLSQQGYNKHAEKLREASGTPPFWRENYDYGEGLYMNQDKYDSVGQYLEERRKNKRKKKKKKS